MRIGFLLLSLVTLLILPQCEQRQTFAAHDNTEERRQFYEKFNRENQLATEQKIAKLRQQLAEQADSPSVADWQQQIASLEKKLREGPFFQRKSIDELPQDLRWESNANEPEIGSPRAKKGGTYRTFFPGMAFPAHDSRAGQGRQ